VAAGVRSYLSPTGTGSTTAATAAAAVAAAVAATTSHVAFAVAALRDGPVVVVLLLGGCLCGIKPVELLAEQCLQRPVGLECRSDIRKPDIPRWCSRRRRRRRRRQSGLRCQGHPTGDATTWHKATAEIAVL
jgi:hypothetical protein